MSVGRITPLILALLLAAWGSAEAAPVGGRAVWWGLDPGGQSQYSDRTNGVFTCGSEIATDIVAVAVSAFEALAVRSDGSVLALGSGRYHGTQMPAGLTNVASVAVEGNSCWAIRRDGTVAQWGGDEDNANIVAGLSNITAMAWAGLTSYLALKNDGTVLGFRFEEKEASGDPANEPPIRQVRVGGQPLSNVVAMASSYNPLILKRDGTVARLGFQTPGAPPSEPVVIKIDETTIATVLGGEGHKTPYEYTTADPVRIGGLILSNVAGITAYGYQALAVRSNGTLVLLGDEGKGGPAPPKDLANVVAVAPRVALKRDGTVTVWGDNDFGQASVPAGLSHVVAIAADGSLNLAITTGSVPASVFIEPHGRLEEMAAGADVILKGRVLSSIRYTNSAFRNPQMDVHATKLQVISVLKGDPAPGTLTFQHYTTGPGAWGGAHWPPYYQLEAGKSYLIFAARLDKPDKYYTPGPGTRVKAGEYRQIADFPRRDDDGVLRTLDARPLDTPLIKEAHWRELNLLLRDVEPTNRLYAIQHLDAMSLSCLQPWGRSEDFSREAVLKALRPLLTDPIDQVAVEAINCFHVGSECATQLLPHASALIALATGAPSIPRRVAALAAFSGTAIPELTNSFSRWLSDPVEEVRAQASLLLPDFPGDYAQETLRRLAIDRSPKVRASAADAIGIGKIQSLLPTLAKLFRDPVGLTNPVPPLTLEELQSGGRTWETNNADVHTSAGYALLKFDLDQVADILKTNLDDSGFRPGFLCKLAEKNAGPWLDDLAAVMEERRKRNQQKAEASGVQPKEHYFQALMALSGTYFNCWNLMFEYLHERPAREFAEGRFDRCLDVLENAGTTGSREPSMIYELYRTKGLDKRALDYRRRCEATFSYDIGYYFKRVDEQLTESRSKSAK